MDDDFINYDKFKLITKTNQFIYLKQLKHTLKKLNLSCIGKKSELQTRLSTFYNKFKYYENNLENVIKVQRLVKTYLGLKNGPGFINKELCINDEDFYTFETKYEIKALYFFSIKDSNGKIFFFDIRSLEKLLNCNRNINPYTTEIISNENIDKIKNRLNVVKKDKKYKPFETQKLTNEQQYNNRVLSIFQKIDLLDVAAGGCDTNWFNNLTVNGLKNMYKGLEDIWNYRADLSDDKKKEIVPERQMFKLKVQYIWNLPNNTKTKIFIRKILLDEIEALISSASNDESKKTGAYFVLTALTDVSIDCRNSFPWLVQYT